MGQLEAKLKRLKLGGVHHTLEERLKEARADNRSHMEFLEVILEDEIERREAKKLELRLSRAGFEEDKTLEGFDWGFNPTLPQRQLRDLATCLFLERHEHLIWILDPVVIRRILGSVGLATDGPVPHPARSSEEVFGRAPAA